MVWASSFRRRLNGGVGDGFGIVGVPVLTLRACLGWGSRFWSDGVRFLIRVSLCSSRIVFCRLCSIRRSYISRRSSTLAFAKSFSANRPRVRSGREGVFSFWFLVLSCDGEGMGTFRPKDLVRLVSGLDSLASCIASIVWFWIRSARFSRHDRLIMRSANIDSIGPWGLSSSRRESRWRSKSAWFSVITTSWRADRPCFRAFWETVALPSWVFGPVDFRAFRRFAWICDWVAPDESGLRLWLSIF